MCVLFMFSLLFSPRKLLSWRILNDHLVTHSRINRLFINFESKNQNRLNEVLCNIILLNNQHLQIEYANCLNYSIQKIFNIDTSLLTDHGFDLGAHH